MINQNAVVRDLVGCVTSVATKHFVEPIGDEDLRNVVRASTESFVGIINALTDLDPNDKAQVELILRNFSSGPLLTYGETELNELIGTVKDTNLKALLTIIVPAISQSLEILIQKGDQEELKKLWVDLAKNPAVFSTIITLLLSLIRN